MKDKETKSKTLFVRNLPFSVNSEYLEKYFGRFGSVKRAFIVTDKEKKKPKGYGYVTFSTNNDCEKILNMSLSIDGRKIFCVPSDSKNSEKSKVSSELKKDQNTNIDIFPTLSKKASDHAIVLENIHKTRSMDDIKNLLGFEKSIRKISKFHMDNKNEYNIVVLFKSVKHVTFAMKKLAKLKDIEFKFCKYFKYRNNLKEFHSVKKNRIIIRNLSFKTTESDLKQIFDKYGEILEIFIPNNNGKKKGFAIVQFKNYEGAQKAVEDVNESNINDRLVAVDWLLPKSTYEKKNMKLMSENPIINKDQDESMTIDDNNKESDNDNESYDNSDAESNKNDEFDDSKDDKDDDIDDDTDDDNYDDDNDDVDDDDIYDNSNINRIQKQNSKCDRINEKYDDESKNLDSNDDDYDYKDDDNHTNKITSPNFKGVKKQLNDAENGRTLFIRNLSFDSVEEDLEEIFENFGELSYCRIVLDPKTEHSRGIAFVQYKTNEDADACLLSSQESGITIDGRKLVITKAVSREKAIEIANKSKTINSDNNTGRNLDLIRLTMIRPGTKAAEDLSKADLSKRLKVESIMREKLKNPNIFVSPTRICVRNIPTSVNDAKLKQIFLKASNKSAKISECRIMRDLNRVNASGLGKSRGYAFISFSRHEDALAAVQATNNNAEIFGKQKRLIVEFSLENKSALISKERRKEKAQGKIDSTKKRLTTKDLSKIVRPSIETKAEAPSKKLPTHWGPKIRHKKREHNLPKKKKKQEKSTKIKEIKRKPKVSKREVRDEIDKLIDKYRRTTQ